MEDRTLIAITTAFLGACIGALAGFILIIVI
jgi:hypothetical protein